MRLGQALRAMREHLGLTQGEMGEKIGIGQTGWSEWEGNSRRLRMPVHLQRLSQEGLELWDGEWHFNPPPTTEEKDQDVEQSAGVRVGQQLTSRGVEGP